MRAVSFSNARVQKSLNDQFVCCYTNTQGDPSAGASFSHAPDDEPGPCGRGAGRQNIQTIFMTPDGEMFHVATGYLAPDDLLTELKFAHELFASLQRKPKSRNETVVKAHRARLKELGFKPGEIAESDSRLSDMFLSGPNPADFGIKVPRPGDFGVGVNLRGLGGNLFADISRRRMLKDHKFAMQHPLMTREEFEQNPQALVGRHKSFFGSHSGMGAITDQVNARLKQARSRKLK